MILKLYFHDTYMEKIINAELIEYSLLDQPH